MVPGCSVLTSTSCQGTRLPTVSTERCTGRASARATVMGGGLVAPGGARGPGGGGGGGAGDGRGRVGAARRSEQHRRGAPRRVIGRQCTAGRRTRASSRPAP